MTDTLDVPRENISLREASVMRENVSLRGGSVTSASPARSTEMVVELVSDVAADQRLFRVDGHARPLPLASAVTQEVIQLARRRNWPQLLSYEQLRYSACGAHVIGFRYEPGNPFPWLLTTTLVHPLANWVASTPHFAVIREPFFVSNEFRPYCGRGHLEEHIEAARRGHPWECLDLSTVPVWPREAGEFLESVIYSCQPWLPVAIDRATISARSTRPFADLYEGFWRGCELLAAQGTRVCVGVTYKRPFLEILEILQLLTGRTCFVVLTCRDPRDREPPLYALLVFTDNVARAGAQIGIDHIRRYRVGDTRRHR